MTIALCAGAAAAVGIIAGWVAREWRFRSTLYRVTPAGEDMAVQVLLNPGDIAWVKASVIREFKTKNRSS